MDVNPISNALDGVAREPIWNAQLWVDRGVEVKWVGDPDQGAIEAQACAVASLEKSRNKHGPGVEFLFMLRSDRSPVMLTCYRQSCRSRRANPKARS